MLSNGFDAPLHIKLNASAGLLIFQTAVTILALIAMLLPSSLPWFIRLGLSLVVAINYLLVARHYLRQRNLPSLLIWNRESGWKEQTLPQSTLAADELLWSSQQCLVVTPWFLLFKLINGKTHKQKLIIKDQCDDPDSFRRLRVLLECLSEIPERQTRFSINFPGSRKD